MMLAKLIDRANKKLYLVKIDGAASVTNLYKKGSAFRPISDVTLCRRPALTSIACPFRSKMRLKVMQGGQKKQIQPGVLPHGKLPMKQSYPPAGGTGPMNTEKDTEKTPRNISTLLFNSCLKRQLGDGMTRQVTMYHDGIGAS
jgi:hypothetical protein